MAERNEEFELKFTGSPTEIAALPQSLIVSALCNNKGEWERLDTTCYDTPDGDLALSGISLRLRNEGGQLVQAVKASRAGGTSIRRDEVETQLTKTAEFPARSGDREFDKILQQVSDKLMPIARTVTDRWTALVTFKRSQIELAVDLGRAESWSPTGVHFQAPLAELELELKDGVHEDVFNLGRLIARNGAFRLCAKSKLETALALTEGGSFRIEPPAKITAISDEPVGDVLQRVLGAIAMRLASLQAPLIEARRVEGVHQMRVALRRLRAVERVFRPHIQSRHVADLAASARVFTRQMAPARDWDVFIEETMSTSLESGYAPACNSHLNVAAQAKRAEGWADAVAAISDPAFTLFLIDLMEASVRTPWRKKARNGLALPVHEFAPRVLDRALKKAVKTAKRIRPGHIEDLHQLRIALKKLRYPVQMFRTIYPKDQRRDYMAALAALQQNFGVVNDAVVAQSLANEAAEGNGDDAMRAAGFVCGYKAAEAEAAASKIETAWATFVAMKPFWRE